MHLVCTWHPWRPTSIRLSWPLTWCFASGDDGNRTHDIYLAKVALCQLSYVPVMGRHNLAAVLAHGNALQHVEIRINRRGGCGGARR